MPTLRTKSRPIVAPPTPDLDTVEDTEDLGVAGTDGYPAQVKVVGRVYTQELPATHSADGSFNVGATETQPAFNADPRRKTLTIWCETFPIWFGTNQSKVQWGTSAHLPAGGSANIAHCDAIWVRGDGGSALVSYITELYGD